MKRVAFLILSEPLIYPPTLNAANILAERGWEVDIYGIKFQTSDYVKTHKSVNFNYIGRHTKGLKNVIQYLKYYFWIIIKTYQYKPNIIISYDPMSVGPAFVLSRWHKIKWFYHVHDLLEKPMGWYRIIKYIEERYASKADNISFPQRQRADLYKHDLNIDRKIDLIYNGPRRNWGRGVGLDPEVAKIKVQFGDILLYQGGISEHFNFEAILQAIRLCKSRFALCIIGKELAEGIINYYKKISQEFGLQERVFFLSPTTYDKLPGISKQASIGLAKFTTNKDAPLNDYLLIGASNKISEYAAMGLPILFPATEINNTFLKEHNIGMTCNTSDPQDLANKIDSILLDENRKKAMGKNAKKIFEFELNFDSQFDELYRKIESCTS